MRPSQKGAHPWEKALGCRFLAEGYAWKAGAHKHPEPEPCQAQVYSHRAWGCGHRA